MGYRIAEPHVRVRTNINREWIWELVTHDGHVASVSRCYRERDPCEAEARSQGLPVMGGRRQKNGRRKSRAPGVRVYADSHGLWHWEHVDDAGQVLAASPMAFLTRDECEREAPRCLIALDSHVETSA
jgi:hypothetical protein